MNAIQLDNVSFRYPVSSNWALSDVTLSIPEGSFFALLGPNGAGKTTLLRLLCGRFPCFSGKLTLAPAYAGKNGFLDPAKYGVLLENPGIYPKLSIEEYVEYFAGFYGFGESGSRQMKCLKDRIQTLAKKLDLPELNTKMSALSLGNRQKVQLLRSMATSPKLLILDEPVANLDPISRETVWGLISDWRRHEGGTAIVCSHVLAEMESEATDFAIIDQGSVLRSGAVTDVSCENESVNLEFSTGVSIEKVREALEKAGLPAANIKSAKYSLSDLYRKTVQ